MKALFILLFSLTTMTAVQAQKSKNVDTLKLSIANFLEKKPTNQWVIVDRMVLYIRSWHEHGNKLPRVRCQKDGLLYELIFHRPGPSVVDRYSPLYSLRRNPNSF